MENDDTIEEGAVSKPEPKRDTGTWSMRHPLIVLILLGVVCVGSMGLVALLGAA